MGIVVITRLFCNMDDCTAHLESEGEHKRKAVEEFAKERGWLKHCHSHFCPNCRPTSEEFLAPKPLKAQPRGVS